MRLEINQFDISRIRSDQVIVLIGKRNTGKSFLARDILSRHAHLPSGVIISPTERSNKFFSHFVPNIFIHHEFDAKIVDNVVRRQEKAVEKAAGSGALTLDGGHLDPRSFIVLDDCLYDSSWRKDKNIRFLFMNGRHIKTMLMITMQYPLGITPDLRTNIDFVFVLRDTNLSNQKRIWEHYAGIFPTFDVFRQVYLKCTENYECLVIDNTRQSNNISDCVFWYKAIEPVPFRMCDTLYWSLSDQLSLCERAGADGADQGEELFDLNSFKKPKHNINVVKR